MSNNRRFPSTLSAVVCHRVGLWENGALITPIAELSLFVMLLTLVLWFVAWLVRRRCGHKLELTPLGWNLRFAVQIIFALNLIFIAGLLGFIVAALQRFELFSDGGNIYIWLIQIVGVLGATGRFNVLTLRAYAVF